MNEEKSRKVLLVEDDKVSQITSTYMLIEYGYEVDLAVTGEETLLKVMKDNYYIIFTDIGLIDMDGYMLAKRIRQKGYNIPIIALTAHNDEETEKACLNADMNYFLAKPLDIKKIQKAIQKLDLE